MDFSLTTVFVLPTGNVLPTTGTTVNLTPAQFGVFLPNYTPATTGNIASAKHIQLYQGRIPSGKPNERTKRSDKIIDTKVVELYKMVAEDTARNQITTFSNFEAKCEEQVSITFRLFSNYIERAYYNGYTETLQQTTPCCDCDGDPCDTLTPEQIEAIVDQYVVQIGESPVLSQFLTAQRTGSGADSELVVEGIALTEYGVPCDIKSFPYEYDKLRFDAWAYIGAPTTQDAPAYINYDVCDTFATVEVTQTSTYPRGSSAQVALDELEWYSFATSQPKDVFTNNVFNSGYVSYVEDGTFYDMYVIRYLNPEVHTYGDYAVQDETSIIYVPTGEAAALETLLETYLGTFEDKSAPDISTTTTTTTTSSTTTTTTTEE